MIFILKETSCSIYQITILPVPTHRSIDNSPHLSAFQQYLSRQHSPTIAFTSPCPDHTTTVPTPEPSASRDCSNGTAAEDRAVNTCGLRSVYRAVVIYCWHVCWQAEPDSTGWGLTIGYAWCREAIIPAEAVTAQTKHDDLPFYTLVDISQNVIDRAYLGWIWRYY